MKKYIACIITFMITGFISFMIAYCVVPSRIIPVNILHKYVGEDGEVYYKLTIDSQNQTVEGNSQLSSGSSSGSGDSGGSGGGNSGGSGDSGITGGNGTPVSSDIEAIITMGDAEFLEYISDGRLTHSQCNQRYGNMKEQFLALQRDLEVPVVVNVWKWSNPGDDNDMSKEPGQVTIRCNKYVQYVIKAAFDEIYAHPSKPVINTYDGCWVCRGIGWNDDKKPSAHSYGCAVDLNAEATVGDYTNKNPGGDKIPTTAEWNSLPECHAKYELFYPDHPIVCIFKKYGFYWGGEFSTTDGMHFGLIGDYIPSASDRSGHGIPNHNAYKNY